MISVYTILAKETETDLIEEATAFQFYYNPLAISDPLAAAKAAVKDYWETEAGKAELKSNNGCFNWGNAACIPEEFFANHGLEPISISDVDVVVDRNEQLAET